MGAVQAGCQHPLLEEFFNVVFEHATNNLNASITQTLRTTRRGVTWIGRGIDNRSHASLNEGLGTGAGATGVVAGLEGNNECGPLSLFGGELAEGINFSVGGARSAVPAFGNDGAGRVQYNTTHLRVNPVAGAIASQCDGATHRGLVGSRRCCAVHLPVLSFR